MNNTIDYTLKPIGFVRSTIHSREEAPKQGSEGAPDAWIEIAPSYMDGLDGVNAGNEVVVLTWFHQAYRDLLKVHPRGDVSRPMRGVFSTRSPDRPNPIGLHRVKVLQIEKNRIKVGPLEALDGTPVIDIKSVMQTE